MGKTIPIPGTDKTLGGEEVFVIAEIGKGFIQTKEEQTTAEYLGNARRLVDAAVASGADAVKFQTHEVEDEVLNIDFTSPHFTGADRYSWVTRNTNATPFDEFWLPLKRYCDEKGIIFFSTPMSRKAGMKLERLGVPLWKVGSGDVQDYVLLDYVASTGKPIMLSTGMISLSELDQLVNYLRGKKAQFVIFYCISQYPAPPEYFNLATIPYIAAKYPDVIVGFSDHSLGDEVSLAAVKVGAKVVEKHFSLSREFWGSDHKVSMLPEEMKSMIEKIRSGAYKTVDEKKYLGSPEKEMEGANNKFRPYFNKSLMAGADIPKGAMLTKEVIFAMRPKMYAGGLSSEEYEHVLGRKLVKALKKYDPITEDVLQ